MFSADCKGGTKSAFYTEVSFLPSSLSPTNGQTYSIHQQVFFFATLAGHYRLKRFDQLIIHEASYGYSLFFIKIFFFLFMMTEVFLLLVNDGFIFVSLKNIRYSIHLGADLPKAPQEEEKRSKNRTTKRSQSLRENEGRKCSPSEMVNNVHQWWVDQAGRGRGQQLAPCIYSIRG